MPPQPMTFGQAIIMARKKKGLSQKDLAWFPCCRSCWFPWS